MLVRKLIVDNECRLQTRVGRLPDNRVEILDVMGEWAPVMMTDDHYREFMEREVRNYNGFGSNRANPPRAAIVEMNVG